MASEDASRYIKMNSSRRLSKHLEVTAESNTEVSANNNTTNNNETTTNTDNT